MGEFFKSGKGLFVGKIEYPLVRLDHLKIEGGDLVKEHLRGSKPSLLSWPVLQALSDGGSRLCHAYLSLLSCVSVMFLFLAASRIAISSIAVRLIPSAWLIA